MCDTVYNTPMNTIGVGDPVPFGINSFGSGDLYGQVLPKRKKGKQLPYTKKQINYGQQLPLIVMAKKK